MNNALRGSEKPNYFERLNISFRVRYLTELRLTRNKFLDMELDGDQISEGVYNTLDSTDPPKSNDKTPKPRGRKPKNALNDSINDIKQPESNQPNVNNDKSGNFNGENRAPSDSSKPVKKLDKAKKKVSAKKSRIKLKYLSAIDLTAKLSKQTIPPNILKCIKDCKLSIINMNGFEQRSCFDFFSRMSKEQIVILFLWHATNATELAFIKEFLFSKKYVDILFRDLDLDNIL